MFRPSTKDRLPVESRFRAVAKDGKQHHQKDRSVYTVPHLALGLLGIAVVLVWGLVEFAGVLFSGSQESAVVQDRGVGESAVVPGSGKRRAVQGSVVGLRIGCRLVC